MELTLYQVDAFTNRVFGGNPAAICLLDDWLDDTLLQSIALENNLSETAYLVPADGHYDLRWFTPAAEIDLCGHATLASAYVIFEFVNPKSRKVEFETKSGRLGVAREGDVLTMDFPSRPPKPIPPSEEIDRILGVTSTELLQSRDILVVLENEEQVRALRPDLMALSQRDDIFAVIVTAPGRSCDFVSRFFAPREGIPEDPVTGSAHCTLIPYWSKRLGKKELLAHQVSARGGELYCVDRGERVWIGGKAALYMKGTIRF